MRQASLGKRVTVDGRAAVDAHGDIGASMTRRAFGPEGASVIWVHVAALRDAVMPSG